MRGHDHEVDQCPAELPCVGLELEVKRAGHHHAEVREVGGDAHERIESDVGPLLDLLDLAAWDAGTACELVAGHSGKLASSAELLVKHAHKYSW